MGFYITILRVLFSNFYLQNTVKSTDVLSHSLLSLGLYNVSGLSSDYEQTCKKFSKGVKSEVLVDALNTPGSRFTFTSYGTSFE